MEQDNEVGEQQINCVGFPEKKKYKCEKIRVMGPELIYFDEM